MNLYLDASVIVAIIGSEPTSAAVDRYVRNSDTNPIISDFGLAECSAALARNGRVHGWTEAEIDGFYQELDFWSVVWTDPVVITPDDVADATSFVRQPGIALRAPDAIHIAVAHRSGTTLLTLDRGMAHAAAALGVPYLNPAETSA